MPPLQTTESADPVGMGHPALVAAPTGSRHMSQTQLGDSVYTLSSNDTSSDVPGSHGLHVSATRMLRDPTPQPQLATEKNSGYWRKKASGESRSTGSPTAGNRRGLQRALPVRQLPAVSPPHDAWEARKEQLRRLYLVDNEPLKRIMERMSQQGFAATPKMYKTRFKRWNFGKNKRRRHLSIANMQQNQSAQLAIDESRTLERDARPAAQIKDSSGYHLPPEATLDNAPSASIVCPWSPSSAILANVTSLNTLGLQELIHFYCLDNYPSVPLLPAPSVYNILRDITTAHILFSQNENRLGGSFCERAFRSIHVLANPTSKLDLFLFLVGNMVWSNDDLTRMAWRYLTAYSTTIPTKSLLQRIFRGFYQYIQEYNFQSYLDFVAGQLVDVFLKHRLLSSGLVVRGFLSLGVIPFFTAQFKNVIHQKREKMDDDKLGNFTKRVALQLATQRIFLEPERSLQDPKATLVSATSRAWNKLLELRLLDHLKKNDQDNVLQSAAELMEISQSCGDLRLYFEGAASAVFAMFYKAKWDGIIEHGDSRHELARLYLEKSINASERCNLQVNGTVLMKLVVLERWQREAGCIEQATGTHRKAREWVRDQSLLMGV